MDIEANIKRARQAIKDAEALYITAGAGIGVDSGLPDFRGNEGFWNAYPPMKRLGISFVEMANPQWFEVNPPLAWGFYGHRLNLYRDTIPHEGFDLLFDIADKKPGKYFVFTSNVDGQFQKAGFDEARIEECHGSIHYFQCTQNCTNRIWDGQDIKINVDMETFSAFPPLPHCPNCEALARPNILMFGDWGWNGSRSSAQSQRFKEWFSGIRERRLRLAVIEMGAGKAVPTVRYQSENVSRLNEAPLLRINPRDYDGPAYTIPLPMGSLEAIQKIIR